MYRNRQTDTVLTVHGPTIRARIFSSKFPELMVSRVAQLGEKVASFVRSILENLQTKNCIFLFWRVQTWTHIGIDLTMLRMECAGNMLSQERSEEIANNNFADCQ